MLGWVLGKVSSLFVERWPDSTNAFTFWYPANLDLETQVETWVVFRKLPNIGLYQSWPTFFFK